MSRCNLSRWETRRKLFNGSFAPCEMLRQFETVHMTQRLRHLGK
ncbi:MAG: hypothetical protein OJF62_000996 [Pseudolabrys sp.]|jgi:hypothetical protein|nr:hypothetical protein [Pseudolabrys sp.]